MFTTEDGCRQVVAQCTLITAIFKKLLLIETALEATSYGVAASLTI